MAPLHPDTVDALNMLLEDERASVEIEVALSNGATEYLEREALTTMGVEDTLISVELRDWLESLNLPVTRRINGIVLQALDLTRYDDRLQLFLQHQLSSREQAEQLLQEAEVDSDGQAILRSISDAHTRHAVWCEQRASEFAETRQFEFRRSNGRSHDRLSDGAESDMLPETSGERSIPRAAARANPMTDSGTDDGDDGDDDMDAEMDAEMDDVASETEARPSE